MNPLPRPSQLFPLVRHLSFHVTPILARLKFTPNLVTAMSLVVGLVAAWSFSFGNAQGDFTGALLFLLSYVLDNCDGELARITGRSSASGQLFDTASDWVVHTTVFIGLGVGSANAQGADSLLWLGLLAALGTTINSAFALARDWRAFRLSGTPSTAPAVAHSDGAQASVVSAPSGWHAQFIYVFRELSRADFCFIVLLLAGLNALWLLVIVGAIGAHVYWITGFMRDAPNFHV